MKKFLFLLLAALMCLCLAACGDSEETAPPVTLTDIAAAPAAPQSMAPADVNELSTSSEDPLAQPIGQPAAEPSGEMIAPPPAPDTLPDTGAAEPAPTDGETEE